MSRKILLIDDEELVVKSIRKLLIKQGYDVVTARDGREAIEHLNAGPVDLVVCDIRMPNMNGVETIQELRNIVKIKGYKPVKEILITGYADEETNKSAESLNVAEYIYKPFDIRDFLAAVQRQLGA